MTAKDMPTEKVREFLNYLDKEIDHQWNMYKRAIESRIFNREALAYNEKLEAKRLEQTKAEFMRILNHEQTLLTLEHALELHGLKELPTGWEKEEIPFFLSSTQKMINRYGEEWIRKNQVRLREELETIAKM